MFITSAVDIARLIKRALDVDVSLYSSSELFICTAIFYLRRLKRFEKITHFSMLQRCSPKCCLRVHLVSPMLLKVELIVFVYFS